MNTKESVIAALQDSLQGNAQPDILERLSKGDNISLSEIDLNSLRMVEISMFLEDALGVEIDFEEFDEVETLDQLVQLCDAQLNQ